MKFTVAESAGFCFGVDRAVKKVYELLKNGEKVYTLGPIIHNPQLVDSLKKQGVIIANDPVEVKENSILVIRSHGISKSIMATTLICCRTSASSTSTTPTPVWQFPN